MRKTSKKLGAIVTAMMLGFELGQAVAAEPAFEQLSEIETMLASNDVDALRGYLLLHPELLEGDTQLALLLRRFLEESANLPRFLGEGSDQQALQPLRIEVDPPDQEPDPDGVPDPGVGDPDDPALY